MSLESISVYLSNQELPPSYVNFEGIFVPTNYLDPYSHKIMRTPVKVLPSGRYYDQSTLDIFNKGQIFQRDPLTKGIIRGEFIAIELQDEINTFLNSNPLLKIISQPLSVCNEELNDLPGTAALINLFRRTNMVTCSPDLMIMLYNNDPSDTWRYTVIEEVNEKFNRIIKLINNQLLPLGKCFDAFEINNQTENQAPFYFQLDKKNLTAELKLQETTCIKVKRGALRTTVDLLFRRMTQENILALPLLQEQILVLEEITERDCERIKKNYPANFYTFLEKSLPSGYRNIEITSTFRLLKFENINELCFVPNANLQLKIHPIEPI
jgi:hypothetical protein